MFMYYIALTLEKVFKFLLVLGIFWQFFDHFPANQN